MNYKDFHIGNLIELLVAERGIDLPRICNFLKCKETEVLEMYQSKSINTDNLLRWSKLLQYDFFRLYTQHLILFSPKNYDLTKSDELSTVPQFRKNIYTKEIIDFILERIEKGKMTKTQVIEEYKIPKTTLYKWINKYQK
ncbi:helix-turn-helix domain-containing protein [Empedobacter falsenii]